MSASYLQYCPEGWQCVPKSVTPAMADAYASLHQNYANAPRS